MIVLVLILIITIKVVHEFTVCFAYSSFFSPHTTHLNDKGLFLPDLRLPCVLAESCVGSRDTLRSIGERQIIVLKRVNIGARIPGFKSKWCSLPPSSAHGQIT